MDTYGSHGDRALPDLSAKRRRRYGGLSDPVVAGPSMFSAATLLGQHSLLRASEPDPLQDGASRRSELRALYKSYRHLKEALQRKEGGAPEAQTSQDIRDAFFQIVDASRGKPSPLSFLPLLEFPSPRFYPQLVSWFRV